MKILPCFVFKQNLLFEFWVRSVDHVGSKDQQAVCCCDVFFVVVVFT